MQRPHESNGCSPPNAPAPNSPVPTQAPPTSHNPCAEVLGEIRVFKDQDAKRWFVAVYEANESWRELPYTSRDSLAAAEEALSAIQEARRPKAVGDTPFDPEIYTWAMGKPMGQA